MSHGLGHRVRVARLSAPITAARVRAATSHSISATAGRQQAARSPFGAETADLYGSNVPRSIAIREGRFGNAFDPSRANQARALRDSCGVHVALPLIMSDAGKSAAKTPSALPRNPHKSGSSRVAPRRSHRQYGIPRHTAVPLLKWVLLALTSHYAGRARLVQFAVPDSSKGNLPSCKRMVSGSNPLTGSYFRTLDLHLFG